MIAEQIVEGIRNAGATVIVDGDHLRINPASVLTAGHKVALKQHKVEVLNFLRHHDDPAAAAVRVRLLAVAKLDRFDKELVQRLTDDDLDELVDFNDETLGAHLQVLEDEARREAGRLPHGHRGAIFCRHCGPVFVDPVIVRVLPVVNGWPTAIGCPWCHIRGRNFPRPSVKSVTCKHWQPGEGSSYAGGDCKCGHHYPNELHRCDQFRPEGKQ